jgi:hypothetical protein
VYTGDTTPDNTNLGAIHSLLGAVHISNALAKVKGSILFALNILNADECGIWALITLATLEALNTALRVETNNHKVSIYVYQIYKSPSSFIYSVITDPLSQYSYSTKSQ